VAILAQDILRKRAAADAWQRMASDVEARLLEVLKVHFTKV
jgi:hypothetical protein